ncbi:MAG: 4-alpha-glucanotransferase [Bacillota bacterium]
MSDTEYRLLRHLARLNRVEAGYRDYTNNRRQASPDALLAALRALGMPVDGMVDVPGVLREYKQAMWRRCLNPVVIAWDKEPARLELRLPAAHTDVTVTCRLSPEKGKTRSWNCRLSHLPVLRGAVVEGVGYVIRALTLPKLPFGYHRFSLALPGRTCETLVIAAPRQACFLPGGNGLIWGVFSPVYALRSGKSWGAGDLTDLRNLQRWVQTLGGGFVATLPLLSAFLDEPFDPSPYAPVSRLFWNEFYLDVAAIPEIRHCAPAREIIESAPLQADAASLRETADADYRRGMTLKRSVLERLARWHFSGPPRRQAALERWVSEYPAVQDYARFRAATEQRRAGWPSWPERMRKGVIQEGEYDPEVERYHLFVQWLAYRQFKALSMEKRRGPGLYLDFPLGVHGAGYDVWRERSVFALNASTGAPPDNLFTGGQDWGFPPFHPERLREQGYRYYIDCLRHHFRHAGILRLDHVMGLHHLFWIPSGLPAQEGVYVRYHSEEFYAILALESSRYRTIIVGEDLGTVPRYVRAAMFRHRLLTMYVLPFEFTDDRKALRPVPARAIASLNTHDMPPFAAFWESLDAESRSALFAFLNEKGLLEAPTDDAAAVLKACLFYLAASPAPILMVNLEDLWLERAPQNIPGTGADAPNWRRKVLYALDEFARMPEVSAILREISRLRK